MPISRVALATSKVGPVALKILRTLFADLLRLLMMGNFSEFGMDLSTSRLSCMQLRATPHLVTAPSFSLSAPTTPVKSSTNYLVSTSAGKCRQSVIVAVNDVTEHYARKSFTNEQPANSRALADFLCPPFALARRKRSLKQAWMAYWKRRAAKHECEELKLEPVQAVLRRKTNEAWTDRHRHVTRKVVVEGGLGVEKIMQHWLVGRKEV